MKYNEKDGTGYMSKPVMVCPNHHIAVEKGNICEACLAGVPTTVGLSLALFDARNKTRCETMAQPLDGWLPSQWSNAMAGEAGECCNITKKMDRIWPANMFKQSWNKPDDQRMEVLNAKLLREIGDAVIYASLLAQRQGSTLEECVRLAFNEKSEEIGSDILI